MSNKKFSIYNNLCFNGDLPPKKIENYYVDYEVICLYNSSIFSTLIF